jgi:hypothetical protein
VIAVPINQIVWPPPLRIVKPPTNSSSGRSAAEGSLDCDGSGPVIGCGNGGDGFASETRRRDRGLLPPGCWADVASAAGC